MRIILAVLTLLLLISPVLAAGVVKITAETAFTDPYPVEPGKKFVLGVKFENKGDSVAESVITKLDPGYPFTVLENPEKELKFVLVGQPRIIEYDMFADSSATSSVYKIPIEITVDGTDVSDAEIQVRVRAVPNFELLDLNAETGSPGEQINVTAIMKNIGGGLAKKASAKFVPASDFVKPVSLGGINYLGDVKSSESREMTFNLLISSDAEYGVYSGTINITYEDEEGNKLFDKFDVGILVSGNPDLNVISTSTQKNELIVKIINQGSAEANGIRGELKVDGKVSDADYISKIKIDKSSSLKFTLPPKTDKAELLMYYKGPDNSEYTETQIVTWEPIKTSFPVWSVFLVLLLVVYFVWKKNILSSVFRLFK